MVAGLPGATNLVAWSVFVKDPETQLERFRNQPQIKKQIDEFKKAWGELRNEKKPIETLFKDRKTSYVVLSAFQLEADINYSARNEKLVSQDLTKNDSLINRLIDGRYSQMAKTLNYKVRGNVIFTSPSTINTIVDKFVVNEFEKSLGKSNPGLREAAYFARNAKNVTDVYQLLGDPVLRSVVVGSLQLPSQTALLDVDKQAQIIKDKLDINKLSAVKGGDSLNTILNKITDAKKERDALKPAYDAAQNATNAIAQLSKSLTAITDKFTEIDTKTNITGSNAAQITFQQGQIGNYLQADGLLTGAESAINDIDSALNRLKTLSQTTISLNPVGDAALIAQNKVEYNDLVNKVQSVINGASFVDPTNGTTRSLLSATPGPGITSVNYQAGPASALQTINGYDLQTFITNLQSANTDFNADNFINANSTVIGAQGGYFAAKNGIKAARTSFETIIGNISQFAVTLDVSDINRGLGSVNNALTRNSTLLTQVNQLKNLATSLSSGTLTAGERTTQSASFFTLQTALNTNLTIAPPGVDNLLTTAGFNYNLFGANSILARGTNFTDVAYDGVRTAPVGPDVTIADANNFLTAVQSSNIINNITGLRTTLTADKAGLDQAVNDLDPYADVRAQLQSAKASLPGIKTSANANNNKNNSLLRGESELTVFLPTGKSYTVKVFENYDTEVEALVTAAADSYITNPTAARTTLATAVQNLGNYRSATSAQSQPIKFDYDQLTNNINTLESQVGKDAAKGPYNNANSFVLQFIQRYLAVTAQTQTANNAYQLGLLPKTNGGINLSALI
jgi:hypothetical protein